MYKLMIVDDEKTIRESLPQAVNFEQYGFKVCVTARNGEDALEKVKAYHPEVILLDVCMPVLDGLGFLRRLHEWKEEALPCIIMLSGYSDFEYARTAVRFGVKAYLTKPLDEDEIGELLTELKIELDTKLQKQDNEKIRQAIKALQKMYHDGDGKRENYQEYLMMHCVSLGADSGKEVYSLVRGCIEERICGEKAAFFRSRGSVITYLVSTEILEEYQYSAMLLARHILYHIKKYGVECALLLDEGLFREKAGTFRRDYDTHLYQMLTEVFWGNERIIMNSGNGQQVGAERRLEQEEAYLEELKEALTEPDEVLIRKVFQKIVEEAEKARLNIVYIQEINYRIYYMLMDLIQKENDGNGGPELRPLEWRDASCFICRGEWIDSLKAQINEVFLHMDNSRRTKREGIAEKVICYLDRHFREQLSLKDVSDQFYVNSSYLGRCIQKATGIGFKQYLNKLRIEEAKRLLNCTDKLIYEIAEEVGFKESKYFVQKFTEEVGKSPMEFRKAGKC